MATAVSCAVSFGAGLARFARAGSRWYGPSDQYVDVYNFYLAWLTGISLTLIGGLIFFCALLAFLRRYATPRRRAGVWGAWLGFGYVVIFSGTVRIAETIAGSNVGGPRDPELLAHLVAAVLYPIAAAWVLGRWNNPVAPPSFVSTSNPRRRRRRRTSSDVTGHARQTAARSQRGLIQRRVLAIVLWLLAGMFALSGAMGSYAQVLYGNFVTDERASRYLYACVIAVGSLLAASSFVLGGVALWRSTARRGRGFEVETKAAGDPAADPPDAAGGRG